MSSAVNTTDAGDRVSLCVLGVSLADGVEIGSTSIDLIKKDQIIVKETGQQIAIPLMSTSSSSSEQGVLGVFRPRS